MFTLTRFSFLFGALLLGSQPLLAQSALALSSATTAADGTASLNLTINSAPGNEPAGLQWTFSYPSANVAAATISAGSALTAAGKSVTCAPVSGGYACVAYGMNANTIANGVVAVRARPRDPR